jgi:hypothetical protein
LSSTWIGNKAIESILWESFNQFDEEFSRLFETQAHSPEERLTGYFVEKLCQYSKIAQGTIRKLIATLKQPWYFSVRYRDMTGTEKAYGADMAFILRSNIKDRMKRRKFILVQCKKMKTRSYPPPGMRFIPSWPIDSDQAENLCQTTPFGYYFLYGPHSTATWTRVIPSRSVVGLMEATRRKATIPLYQTILSSRSFADFFLYDFIGCWIGDEREYKFRLVEGDYPEIPVRYLVYVDISHG